MFLHGVYSFCPHLKQKWQQIQRWRRHYIILVSQDQKDLEFSLQDASVPDRARITRWGNRSLTFKL